MKSLACSHFVNSCYYLVLLHGASLSYGHLILTKKAENQKLFLNLSPGTNLIPMMALLKLVNGYNRHPCHLQKHQLILVKSNTRKERLMATPHSSQCIRTQLHAACRPLLLLSMQQEGLTSTCLGLPLKTLSLSYTIRV